MTKPRISLVYPTRHRPAFIAQALRLLESQRFDRFQVIVSDNYLDPAQSCEQTCRDSSLRDLTYVRPPRPIGMVENWNYALAHTTGDYVGYLTDKMFVLPGALERIERAIGDAGDPEIVSWTSDAYNPSSHDDYFGPGWYARMSSGTTPSAATPFSPAAGLDRRGRAEVSRQEQRPSDYARGKIVFGAYGRGLIERITRRYGALFHDISPDYTSMVLGMTEAHGAIELSSSCVVGVNTDISNGLLMDTDDRAALAFLTTAAGGAEVAMAGMLVPGLYASLHNVVTHDFLTLRATFGLDFEFSIPNWLVYCTEDIYRPGRRWSAMDVEADQKLRLAKFIDSQDPAVAAIVRERLSTRSALREARLAHREGWRRLVPAPLRPAARWARRYLRPPQPGQWLGSPAASLDEAVAREALG